MSPPPPSGRPRAPGRSRSCVGDEAKTARIVSLNWRTLQKPDANAIAVIGIAVVSISTRAVWRALRPGEGERAGTDLGDEHALDLALAVAEPGGETAHALAVDEPVGDEPHCPADDVRRARSTPASRGSRPGGSACRPGTRAAPRPRQ